MKKFGKFFFPVCLILVMSLLISPVLATQTTTVPEDTVSTDNQISTDIPLLTVGDASVTNGCHTMDARVPLGGSQKMLDTAKSAVLYELNSGTLLYAYEPDLKVYPASLVKIMTALLVVENADLTATVEAKQDTLDSVPYDAVSIQIKAGEIFTVNDLLHAMLVESANDACAILAETVSDTQEEFVSLMNQRAAELGCSNTNFTNALGIHDENMYTTARDMGKILEEAVKYEAFRNAFGAEEYIIPANDISEERHLITTNYFAFADNVVKFNDKRVTGGKSGAINTSDRSLVVTAQEGSLNLMSVVMSAEGVLEEDGYTLKVTGNFEETSELLQFGFDNYSVSQILYSGKSVAQFPVTGGENHVVGRPEQSVFSALPWGTTEDKLTWRYLQAQTGLEAPVIAGQSIGTVQVWYANLCLAQSDMVAMNSSKLEQNPFDDQSGDGDAGLSGLGMVLQILGVIFGIVIGLAFLFVVVNLIRRAAVRARRKRRRRNRRRSR